MNDKKLIAEQAKYECEQMASEISKDEAVVRISNIKVCSLEDLQALCYALTAIKKLEQIEDIIEKLDQDMLMTAKPYYRASRKIKDILGVTDDTEDF